MSWTLFILGNIWMVSIILAYAFYEQSQSGLPASPLGILAVILTAAAPIGLAAILPRRIFQDIEVIQNMSGSIFGAQLPEMSPVLIFPNIPTLAQLATMGYILVASALIARVFWKLRLIRNLPVIAVKPYQGVNIHIVEADLPPCSLGWPQNKILMPESLIRNLSAADFDMIAAHEKTHLRFRDPEITLLLLCLSALFWMNPLFAWLVSRWRISAELRADAYAIEGCDPSLRADYGRLLLSLTGKKNGRALPCPSANLSHPARSIKMRLNNILTVNPHPRKRQALLGIAALATLISGGGTLALASATPSTHDAANVQPLTRAAPIMPASCPGFDPSTISKTTKVMGGKSYEMAEVGRVYVKFDVTPGGKVENVTITKSNYDCFNDPGKASAKKWTYPTSVSGYKNLESLLIFMLSDNEDELQLALDKFGKTE